MHAIPIYNTRDGVVCPKKSRKPAPGSLPTLFRQYRVFRNLRLSSTDDFKNIAFSNRDLCPIQPEFT